MYPLHPSLNTRRFLMSHLFLHYRGVTQTFEMEVFWFLGIVHMVQSQQDDDDAMMMRKRFTPDGFS